VLTLGSHPPTFVTRETGCGGRAGWPAAWTGESSFSGDYVALPPDMGPVVSETEVTRA
jgi:hypothetical protein